MLLPAVSTALRAAASHDSVLTPMTSVTREEAIAHSRAIVEAVERPVSADLENGFADDAEGVAETVRAAAAAGLAGCSIEDWSGAEIYEPEHAAERIAAAAEAARGDGL